MEPRGQVQKLSVAVLVDGTYEQGKYVARSENELEVIKGMVKRAVGFDAERGDEIEVANVPFKLQPASAPQPALPPTMKEMIQSPLGLGAGIAACLIIGLFIFVLLKRRSRRAPVEPSRMAEAPAVTMTQAAVQEEVSVAAQKVVVADDPRKEQLTQIARDYHDATARIIRMWLQEDASKARMQSAGGTR